MPMNYKSCGTHVVKNEEAIASTTPYCIYPGDCSLSRMGIVNSIANPTSFDIITTGARFRYASGQLDIYQGLSSTKTLIASILVNFGWMTLVSETSDHTCYTSDVADLHIFGDSTIVIHINQTTEFNVVGHFTPEYAGIARTSYYFSQDIAELYMVREGKAGGIQIVPERHDLAAGYTVQDIYVEGDSNFPNSGGNEYGIDSSFYTHEWGVSYSFSKGQRVLINTFPTRTLDYDTWQTRQIASFLYTELYFEDLLEVEDIYNIPIPSDVTEPTWPSDSDIDTMKTTGDVVVIWGTGLYDTSSSYYKNAVTPKYYFWDVETLSIRESAKTGLRDFIDRCHAKEMKVIFYVSYYYFFSAYGDRESFYNQIKAMKEEMGIDGIYCDGFTEDHKDSIYPYRKGFSFVENWDFSRRMRQIFGKDGIVYIHNTNLASIYRNVGSDNIHSTTNVAALSYADISLKSEGVSISSLDDFYLKYHTSQYKLSNAYSDTIYNAAKITIPATDIAEWMAEQYGASKMAWSYNPSGNSYVWQRTYNIVYNTPFLAKAATMTDPN